MSCILIITEDNKVIQSQDNKSIEKEESLCPIINPSGCFIIETEGGQELTTESNLFLETENSSCQTITILPIGIPKVLNPYITFTRKQGFKYIDENPLKYNSLK
jgi:hypothetical protein